MKLEVRSDEVRRPSRASIICDEEEEEKKSHFITSTEIKKNKMNVFSDWKIEGGRK